MWVGHKWTIKYIYSCPQSSTKIAEAEAEGERNIFVQITLSPKFTAYYFLNLYVSNYNPEQQGVGD